MLDGVGGRISERVGVIVVANVVVLGLAVGAAVGSVASDTNRSVTGEAAAPSITPTTTVPPGPYVLRFTRVPPGQGSKTEVYEVGADGSGLHAVPELAGAAIASRPTVGRRVVYAKELSRRSVGSPRFGCGFAGCSMSETELVESGIAIARMDGSHERVLTRGGYDSSPAISPDGTRIAFTRHIERFGEAADVVSLISADGTHGRDLAPPVGEDEGSPAWSPDGRFLAVVRRAAELPTTVAIRDLVTGVERVIADGNFTSLDWSHDGSRLVATLENPIPATVPTGELPVGGSELWVLFTDGSPPRQLTRLSPGHFRNGSYCGESGGWEPAVGHPLWSPDDQFIAFTSSYRHSAQFARHRDVMVIRPDGSDLRMVFAAPKLPCPHDLVDESVDVQSWVR